jgi:MFS family permease
VLQPAHLSYRWVIIGAGARMTRVAIGAMFSLAVFLQPMSVESGWSRAGISSAMTFNSLTMGVAGFGWGAASDRFGARLVVLAGVMPFYAVLACAYFAKGAKKWLPSRKPETCQGLRSEVCFLARVPCAPAPFSQRHLL